MAIDPLLLETLPRREFRSGLYEVVKYGVIASRDLFDRVARDTKRIFARESDVLLPVIVESCRIKARVVAADEREGGLRRVLNFGHTVGHALEAVTKYRRYRHGEAIALGMVIALAINSSTIEKPAFLTGPTTSSSAQPSAPARQVPGRGPRAPSRCRGQRPSA